MMRIIVISLALLSAACCERPPQPMQGYGEADYLYLSAQDTGVIDDVFVREGDVVQAEQQVFVLDRRRLALSAQSASASSAAAAAAIRTAVAQAALAQANYDRSLQLFERGFYSQARLDNDRAARDAANATLAQVRREAGAAGAASGLARERVDDLVVRAPAAGTIEQIFLRAGELAATGQPIVALLTPENMKVRFFAPQALLAELTVGARVLVSCDGCAEPLPARVSFIASEPQFTPPVIYSLDQREKLVFLVEARLETPGPIRPGMPVDVRLAGDE